MANIILTETDRIEGRKAIQRIVAACEGLVSKSEGLECIDRNVSEIRNALCPLQLAFDNLGEDSLRLVVTGVMAELDTVMLYSRLSETDRRETAQRRAVNAARSMLLTLRGER